ncbi:MAG: hypothetical protein AAB037_03645 [Chloroflexota bacterium]
MVLGPVHELLKIENVFEIYKRQIVNDVGLVNLLVWYGRLHYRLLKPAIEPQG